MIGQASYKPSKATNNKRISTNISIKINNKLSTLPSKKESNVFFGLV
jgi:hypothetical protein